MCTIISMSSRPFCELVQTEFPRNMFAQIKDKVTVMQFDWEQLSPHSVSFNLTGHISGVRPNLLSDKATKEQKWEIPMKRFPFLDDFILQNIN